MESIAVLLVLAFVSLAYRFCLLVRAQEASDAARKAAHPPAPREESGAAAVLSAAARLRGLVECSRYTLPNDAWAAHPLVQTTVLYSKLHRIPTSAPRAGKAGAPDKTTASTITATRETLSCPDGGTIAVDWLALSGVRAPPSRPDAPVIVAFQGVGACASHIGFAPMLLGALLERGHAEGCAPRVCSVVYPGFNGLPLSSHKLPGTAYLSTGDAGVVLRHVRALHPTAPLVLIGCSFGSAMLANWTSRNAREAAALGIGAILLYAYGHSAATTVCVADASYAGLTSRFIAGKWRHHILESADEHGPANVAALQGLESRLPAFRLRALAAATSIGEWDAACLPAYGFSSLAHMLAEADPIHTFANLETVCPVVLFNADDDWLCPSGRLAAAQGALYGRMGNVVLVETHGGGHLGWIDQLGGGGGGEADGGAVKRQPDETGASPPASPDAAQPRALGEHASWIVNLTAQLVSACGGPRPASDQQETEPCPACQ